MCLSSISGHHVKHHPQVAQDNAVPGARQDDFQQHGLHIDVSALSLTKDLTTRIFPTILLLHVRYQGIPPLHPKVTG